MGSGFSVNNLFHKPQPTPQPTPQPAPQPAPQQKQSITLSKIPYPNLKGIMKRIVAVYRVNEPDYGSLNSNIGGIELGAILSNAKIINMVQLYYMIGKQARPVMLNGKCVVQFTTNDLNQNNCYLIDCKLNLSKYDLNIMGKKISFIGMKNGLLYLNLPTRPLDAKLEVDKLIRERMGPADLRLQGLDPLPMFPVGIKTKKLTLSPAAVQAREKSKVIQQHQLVRPINAKLEVDKAALMNYSRYPRLEADMGVHVHKNMTKNDYEKLLQRGRRHGHPMGYR